jgi:hypothetical protein
LSKELFLFGLLSLDLSDLGFNVSGMGGPVLAGLGNEDLDFTIVKIERKDAILDGNTISWIEDVA